MFPDPLARQRIEQFHLKHGGDAESYYSKQSGTVYYSDGARHCDYPMGAFVEPPADIRERNQVRLQYYQFKLQAAVKAFDEMRNKMLQLANLADEIPLKEDVAKLKELHERAIQAKAKLEAVTKELRTPEEADREAQLAEWKARRQEQKSKLTAEITALQV